MGLGRKAQAGAAVLIALIALLIILYVLFLPPTERAILLGEDVPGNSDQPQPGETVIFTTVPRLAEQTGPEQRYLPSFTVRTITEGGVLAERAGMVIERSAFHEDSETFQFSVPPNTENLYLSFTVNQGMGDLTISLNGQTIYDQAVPGRQPNPILLNPSQLQGQNELVFSTSGVGFAIWKTNRYEISNIRITADVTTFDEAAQQQRFVVDDLDKLERAQLAFFADCLDSPGRMRVDLNGQTLYSGRPECGQELSFDLALSRLSEGENSLSWSVEDAEYYVDDVRVILQKEREQVAESFIVSEQLYSRILSQQGQLMMRLSFRSPGAEGVVVLNGEELAFRTHKQSFAAPITQFVSPGSNQVMLAETTTDVTALEVVVG